MRIDNSSQSSNTFHAIGLEKSGNELSLKLDPLKSISDRQSSVINSSAPFSDSGYEEITLQFSDSISANQRVLQDRLRTSVERVPGESLSVEQVRTMVKLMEGHEAYDHLRAQVRSFVQAWRQGDQQALAWLLPESMDASKRFSLLRLSIDALEKSGYSPLANRLQIENTDILQHTFDLKISNLNSNIGASTTQHSANDTELENNNEKILHLKSIQMQYWQLIGNRPTPRAVLDTASTVGNSDNLLTNLSELQNIVPNFQSQNLEELSAAIIVTHMISVVRTMINHADKLLIHVGVTSGIALKLSSLYGRHLIDLSNASVTSPLLDKLANTLLAIERYCPQCQNIRNGLLSNDNLKATCRCNQPKLWVWSFLYQQVRLWPDAVWTSSEGKGALLQQLVRKQSPHTR